MRPSKCMYRRQGSKIGTVLYGGPLPIKTLQPIDSDNMRSAIYIVFTVTGFQIMYWLFYCYRLPLSPKEHSSRYDNRTARHFISRRYEAKWRVFFCLRWGPLAARRGTFDSRLAPLTGRSRRHFIGEGSRCHLPFTSLNCY